MTVLVVTGTGTGVGKTVVTAAIAAVAAAAGHRVALVKPAQTGVAEGEPGDVHLAARLSQVHDVHELGRYPDPLAPETAARRAGMSTLPCRGVIDAISDLARHRDLVVVEGSGGLLVRLDNRGGTIADVAAALDADVLVVTAAGLGVLNAAALTVEALVRRDITCAGLVIGSWPTGPDLAARCNVTDLQAYTGRPLLGALPEASGMLRPEAFLRMAQRSLGPRLGGHWDVAAFEAAAGCAAH